MVRMASLAGEYKMYTIDMTTTEERFGIFYEGLCSMPLAMNHHPYIEAVNRPPYLEMPTPLGYKKLGYRVPNAHEPFLGRDGDVWVLDQETADGCSADVDGSDKFLYFILEYTGDGVIDKTVSRVRPGGVFGGVGLTVMSWVYIPTGKILCSNPICTNRHPHIEKNRQPFHNSMLSRIFGQRKRQDE